MGLDGRRIKDESSSDRAGRGLGLAWLFVLVWFGGLALFALVVHAAPRHLDQPKEPAYLILGGFALAGLLPLAFTIRETRHRFRFGASVFAMSSATGVIGGRLGGTIELPLPLPEGARVRATLTCWSRATHPDFPNRLLWQAPPVEVVASGGPPARAPVSFEIPFECSASEPVGVPGGVYWQLRAEGQHAAAGLDASFVVPVRLTPESRPPERGGPAFPTGPPPDSTASLERPSPGVLRLKYRFGPLASFSCVFLPIAMPAVLLLAGIAGVALPVWALLATAAVVAFALLTHFTDVMRVEVAQERMRLSRGYRGWFGSRTVPLADLRRIDLDTTYNDYKRVVALTRDLETIAISRWTTVMEARWIADEVRGGITAAGGRLDG